MQILAPETCAERLADLHPRWSLAGGKLHADLTFPDFRAAFAFMTRVADLAEERDHHPDWSNVYDRVAIDLVTHSAGGLTTLDFELAAAIDGVAGQALDRGTKPE